MFCGRFSLSVRCSNWPLEMGPSRPAQGDFGPVGQSCNTSFQLQFRVNVKQLVGITVYPYALKWAEVEIQLGRKYKTARTPGGGTNFTYTDKPPWASVDRDGFVVTLNITESTLAYRVLAGEPARNDWHITLTRPSMKVRSHKLGTPAPVNVSIAFNNFKVNVGSISCPP